MRRPAGIFFLGVILGMLLMFFISNKLIGSIMIALIGICAYLCLIDCR